MKIALCIAAFVQAAIGLGFVNTILVPGVNPWTANLNPGVNTNFLSQTTLSGPTTRPAQFRDLRNPFIYTETVVPFPGWVLIDRSSAAGLDVYGQYPFLSYQQFNEVTLSPTGSDVYFTGYIVFDADGHLRNDYVLFHFSTTKVGATTPTQLCKHITLNGQLQYLCPETAIAGYFTSPGQSSDFTQSKFNVPANLRTQRRSYDSFTRSTSFEQLDFAYPSPPFQGMGTKNLVGDYISITDGTIPGFVNPVTNNGIVPCCDFQ